MPGLRAHYWAGYDGFRCVKTGGPHMLQRTKALVATASLISILGNFGITLGSAVGAEACRFSTVRLHPTETNKYETYVGKGKNLEIVVTNGTGEPADLFLIRRISSATRTGRAGAGFTGG